MSNIKIGSLQANTFTVDFSQYKFHVKVKMEDGTDWEFTPRWIGIENGMPDRVCAPNGMQYRDFELMFHKKG